MIVDVEKRGHCFLSVTEKFAQENKGVHETFNLGTDDLRTAARRMDWTDRNRQYIRMANGGKLAGSHGTAGNVYRWSLSWDPSEDPTWEHMRETALSSVEVRGLQDYEFYIVEIPELPYRHLCVVASLVHPQTGLIANCWKDQKLFDRWANEYEKQNGVVCEDRARKYARWEEQIRKGEPLRAFPEKQDHAQTIAACFHASKDGQAFSRSLQSHGLTLALGRNRSIAIVDGEGGIHALIRNLQRVKGQRVGRTSVNRKLADIDKATLETVDTVRSARRKTA